MKRGDTAIVTATAGTWATLGRHQRDWQQLSTTLRELFARPIGLWACCMQCDLREAAMLDQLQNSGIAVLNDAPIGRHATIIIVGVPRSGTTMVAKTLGALGVYLGADLDEAIQEDLRLAKAIEDSPADISLVIEAYNSAHDVWAFKRPTAYQTLDASWFRNPRFIIPFRDPVAIAKREEISMVFDFRDQLRRAALWSIDLADFTLRQTAPLMLVSYEKALLKPERFVDELAQFSGADASEAMRRAASIVVKPSPADYVKGSQVRLSQDAISDVAVILPFYNGSKYIRRAVESVQRQSLAPAEFVVVNDGSKPEEAEFLHALAEELGFRVIDQKNGGQGAARNAGVASTVSPYICLLDQDDFFLPDHIEVLRAAVQDNERFGWAYADLMEADGDGNIVRSAVIKAHSSHPKADIFNMLSGDMFVLPSASIISRSAFKAVQGFDQQFMGYEDDDLFLRMFRAGFTNTFIDRAVTVWCINSESTSYSIRMSRSRWRFLKKVYQAFPSDPVRSRYVLRDVLVPRFNPSIVGEAFQAVVRPNSVRGRTLAPHADELISILQDYKDLVLREPWVSSGTKWKIFVRTILISTRSRLLNEVAQFFAAVFRWVRGR